MRIVDAHQHFWSLGEPGHEWPTAEWPLVYRDFGIGDLRAATAGTNFAGTVLVQSQPNDHDTDWMLTLANAEPLVKAVVGWVDLASLKAPARIAELALSPKLRGLRPMLQGNLDTDWLLRAELTPALSAMQDYGLRLDALVQPRHLPMLATFAARWPTLPIVIDHAAKPFAAKGTLDPWRDDMARLADVGLHCKLSGLRTEQTLGQSAADLMPYVSHLVACFRERLMWGSDWPVIGLAGDSWADWLRDANELAADADPDQLFEGCATRFYDLEH